MESVRKPKPKNMSLIVTIVAVVVVIAAVATVILMGGGGKGPSGASTARDALDGFVESVNARHWMDAVSYTTLQFANADHKADRALEIKSSVGERTIEVGNVTVMTKAEYLDDYPTNANWTEGRIAYWENSSGESVSDWCFISGELMYKDRSSGDVTDTDNMWEIFVKIDSNWYWFQQ